MEKIYAGTARMLTTQFGTLPKVTFSRKRNFKALELQRGGN